MNDLKRLIIVLLTLTLIIMGVLGIKGLTDDAGYKKQTRYTTAVKAEDAERFNYAVDTQQGNLLVHGTFSTKNKNLVKFDEMTKGFTYVERVKEHYTRHTSTYSCGESTCTSTYYSWDFVGSDDMNTDKISFYGREYDGNLFNYDDFKEQVACESFTKANTARGWFSSKKGCDDGHYYLDNDNRYYYSVVPKSFSATFLASSMGGGLNPVGEKVISLKTNSIDQEMERVGSYKVIGAWVAGIFIFLLSIAAIGVGYTWVMEDGRWSIRD